MSTFIDLGFDVSVNAGDIIAIKKYMPEDENNLGVEYTTESYGHDLFTAVKLRSGFWYPSSLTYRELRNRLRKAGYDFI